MDSVSYAATRGDPEGGRAILTRMLTRYPMDSLEPADRDWDAVMGAALAVGDAATARAALTGFARDLASGVPDSIGAHARYAAGVAVTEERWDDAIRLIAEARDRHSVFVRIATYYTGFAHDRAGHADSAIAYYAQFVTGLGPDPWDDAQFRAPTHFRLGELYEARGDLQKATDQYAAFVRLWKDADPELQPRVREARERMAKLGARTG
jgi:tetratricopeptide (TPR) repeat protein